MTIILIFSALWLFGMMLTVKLDAVLAIQPSSYFAKGLTAIVFWPAIAVLLLTTKHKASNVTETYKY